MVALRIALGYATQAGWASWLGMGEKRWANFERGFPVSTSACAILIQKVPGITRDWILDGVESGMPLHIIKAIRDAADTVAIRAPAPRVKRAVNGAGRGEANTPDTLHMQASFAGRQFRQIAPKLEAPDDPPHQTDARERGQGADHKSASTAKLRPDARKHS